MRRKRIAASIMAATLALSLLAGCADGTQTQSSVSSTDTQASSGEFDISFSARDLDVGYDESTAAKVTLAGSSITVDGGGTSVNGSVLTISAEGIYILSGELTDGQIVVQAADTAKIQLVLKNAAIHNDSGPAILIKEADKVFITLAEGSENTLSDGTEYVTDADVSNADATVFSKADLCFNGTGSLTATGNYKHAVISKDDLIITGGAYTVQAASGGLYGKDCVKIADGSFVIETGTDGIKSDNEEDATRGFVYIADGNFDITAGTDGVQAQTMLRVDGGSFSVATGGGSANASTTTSGEVNESWGQWGGGKAQQGGTPPDMTAGATESQRPTVTTEGAVTASTLTASTQETTEDSTSAKGLKAGSMLIVNGGSFTLDTSDDAVHSNGTLSVTGGTLKASAGDDGFHADAALTISGGTVIIDKCYEGIEGLSIDITGGDITLTASDDGLNAAGGNDSSAVGGRPGQNTFSENGDDYIRITGGTLRVNAAGDGIDSNGALYVEGGTIYVDGPTNSANGALDYDGTGSISGGTIIAVSASGMAMGFGSDSTQCSILYNFSTTLSAGDTVKLTDASGNVLAEYTPAKQYQSVTISAPGMTEGQTYTLSAGTQTAQVTQSSLSVSNGGGQMGGGMGQGGPGTR